MPDIANYLRVVSVSKDIRRSCSMRFTPYMAACSRQLTEREEYPTDHRIGPTIHLQTLNVKVAEMFGYFGEDTDAIRGEMALQSAVNSFFHDPCPIRDSCKELLCTLNPRIITNLFWHTEEQLLTIRQMAPFASKQNISKHGFRKLRFTITHGPIQLHDMASRILAIMPTTGHLLGYECSGVSSTSITRPSRHFELY